MAEEGVVQLFIPDDGSPSLIGVIGALQIDVLKERLKIEYGMPVNFESARFSVCRWISSEDKHELQKFLINHRSAIAHDLDGDAVFLAENHFSLNYEAERAPKIKFSAFKDYQVRSE